MSSFLRSFPRAKIKKRVKKMEENKRMEEKKLKKEKRIEEKKESLFQKLIRSKKSNESQIRCGVQES